MQSLRVASLAARRDGKPIFTPLDLLVDAPQAVEVVGPNGAGKTTFLRMLAGLYRQYDGEFEIPPALYQGHRLGLDELDSVVANLVALTRLEGMQPAEKRIRRALSKVGMLRMGLTQVGKLSQGQQRRVAMARWLLSSRSLWLLDEPLVALDTAGQALLAQLIDAHVAQGHVVIYSSHVPLPLASKMTLNVEAVT